MIVSAAHNSARAIGGVLRFCHQRLAGKVLACTITLDEHMIAATRIFLYLRETVLASDSQHRLAYL